MIFSPLEVTVPHLIYACFGGFVILFGLFSLFLRERLYTGEACWAFLFGVIIGPHGANVFDPRSWGNGTTEATNAFTLEFTRVVLATGVFAVGVELPHGYLARHWKSLFFLLVPITIWGWFVSAALIHGLIPSVNFVSSLVISACLMPTDPILAAAIVGGKWADNHVPTHLRHLLAAASGCNDGVAFPFLFIALYLLLEAPDTGGAIRDWFVILWFYKVFLGITIGVILGVGFRYLFKFCQRYDLIDRPSNVAQCVSLSALTIGITTLLGTDDLVAAFACGTAFAWDGSFSDRQNEESVFSTAIDLLLNIAAFIFVGAWMPFDSFTDADLSLSIWRLIVLSVAIFMLRRLPATMALYRWIPDLHTFREAVFTGHFGPMGVSAIFVSTLATEIIRQDTHPHSAQADLLPKTIQPVVAFVVMCSIAVHGLSIPCFSLGLHTVSRYATPEWVHQVRLVQRGSTNIVINTSNQMERGEVSLSVNNVEVKHKVESPLPPVSPASEVSVDHTARDDDGAETMNEVTVSEDDTGSDISRDDDSSLDVALQDEDLQVSQQRRSLEDEVRVVYTGGAPLSRQ